MKKNKSIIIMAVVFLAIGWMFSCENVFAQSSGGEEGVWANFMVRSGSDGEYLREVGVFDNINFWSLDSVGEFGSYRINTVGDPNYAHINIRADIYIPVTGDYEFWARKEWPVDFKITIDDECFFLGRWNSSGELDLCNAGDTRRLTEGWHSFRAYIDTRTAQTPRAVLRWKIPETSSFVTIPKENFSWETHSDMELVIPTETGNEEDEKTIGYYTAGVGINEDLEDGENPRITIKIPEESERGPSNEDFLDIYDSESATDGSYVFWYPGVNENNPQITIQNDSISGYPQRTLFGTRIVSINGHSRSAAYAKIPSELVQFNESSREMSFEFKNLSFYDKDTKTGTDNGLAVILPYLDDYVDPSNPTTTEAPTRLTIKFPIHYTYRGTHPVEIFDLDDDIDNSDLRPFFFFPDGQTKQEAPVNYRPNHMWTLFGSGSEPAPDAWLERDYSASERIFPDQGIGNLNLGNTDTWYPVFGREGLKFDALSARGSYLPNEENSYVDSAGHDAVIDPIDAGSNKWIAFQWYSSNFASDGVSGSPESGGLSVIGLLGGKKDRRLAICTTDNRTIYKKDIVNLQAWFWDNYTGGSDLCDDPVGTGAVPVTDVSIWSSNNSSIVRLEGVTPGAFVGVNRGLTEVVAKYTYSGIDLEAKTEIQVIELDSCYYRICDSTTEYECRTVTLVGDSCPAPASTCSIPSTCKPDNPWKEVAP